MPRRRARPPRRHRPRQPPPTRASRLPHLPARWRIPHPATPPSRALLAPPPGVPPSARGRLQARGGQRQPVPPWRSPCPTHLHPRQPLPPPRPRAHLRAVSRAWSARASASATGTVSASPRRAPVGRCRPSPRRPRRPRAPRRPPLPRRPARRPTRSQQGSPGLRLPATSPGRPLLWWRLLPEPHRRLWRPRRFCLCQLAPRGCTPGSAPRAPPRHRRQ
mmetsp:Transcript_100347/g.288328  ORF Transcript_100347/g.288328 Transcript_100347/m.288328 type:complete len:219 (-) Transcript_100347:26-682(-)